MIKASCALYRSSLALSFVLLTSLFTACGGGGGSSPGGGGITPPPISTTVTAGSRIQFLYGLAGNRAVFDVKVVDGQARPVPNAAVTFSASLSGVELYPTQATTTSFGIVQTVIHLPPAANASFTVTATAATGGSFTATVNTGMRLVRTIGAPNAAGGVVRSDGSFISGGTTSDVGAIFNPDGTLR